MKEMWPQILGFHFLMKPPLFVRCQHWCCKYEEKGRSSDTGGLELLIWKGEVSLFDVVNNQIILWLCLSLRGAHPTAEENKSHTPPQGRVLATLNHLSYNIWKQCAQNQKQDITAPNIFMCVRWHRDTRYPQGFVCLTAPTWSIATLQYITLVSGGCSLLFERLLQHIPASSWRWVWFNISLYSCLPATTLL